MRVLHLTTEFPPVIWGGLGTAVGGVVIASARAGMSVAVLLVGGVLLPDGRYSGWRPVPPDSMQLDAAGTAVAFDGVTFFHVSPNDGIDAGLKFAKAWQPDVVHLHSAWLWPVARAIREDRGTPIVFTVHSLDRAEYERGGFVTQWEPQEAVIHAVDRIIAISESERVLIMNYCPTVTQRVRVIGNGIDDTPHSQAATRRKRIHSPLVMFSGRFVDRKGIFELLSAIPLVLSVEPETRFILVGGYGSAADVERVWLAGPLLIYHENIRFTGWLPPSEVMHFYNEADILVVPSWYEPFGMVVLEGMLYGLAVAAANVGGPAEILEHESTGLLFAPRNINALTQAILTLVRDAKLREKLGLEAAAEVRRRWLWPRLIASYRSVYREVTNIALTQY